MKFSDNSVKRKRKKERNALCLDLATSVKDNSFKGEKFLEMGLLGFFMFRVLWEVFTLDLVSTLWKT